MTSWITLHPQWYARERTEIARRWPGCQVSRRELARGKLVLSGEISFGVNGEFQRQPVALVYPADTPYRIPFIIPLKELPTGDWDLVDVYRPENVARMPSGYRRHQMADGNLCLIEAESHTSKDIVSGVDVLRRAKEVFKAVTLNQPFPFPDSVEADLEAHFYSVDDIILPQCFYSDEVRDRGVFYAYPHLDWSPHSPGFILQETPRTLLVGVNLAESTAAGVETGAQNAADPYLARSFPWLANARFTYEGMTENDQLRRLAYRGYWYDVPFEPQPCRDGRELEDVLRKAGFHRPEGELERWLEDIHSPALVGLRYRDREGHYQWLVLRLAVIENIKAEEFKTALQREEHVRLDVARNALIGIWRTHQLERAKLELRNKGTVATTLSNTKVLLIGAGALGGDIAVALAKAGAERIGLMDFDRLRFVNTIRHVAGIATTGVLKIEAVRHHIWQHHPFVDVTLYNHAAGADLEKLERTMSEYDIVVCTTADENVEAVVNETAVRIPKTVVYARALYGGAIGRIFRVKPEQEACKACLVHHASSNPDWVDVPEKENEIVARECGRPVLAASSSDLRLVADLATRTVIDAIGKGTGPNMLLFAMEAAPTVSVRFSEPFMAVWQSFDKVPECAVCGKPHVQRIELSLYARDTMVAFAEAKPTVETGGVLIGYVDDSGVAHVVEATDAGPNAIEERTRFERDTEHCQALLADAAQRLGEHGLYIGEWHSHIEPRPLPSPRDIESLTGISSAPNYLTNEPIMLIAGVDPATSRVAEIHGSCFPIGKRAFARDVLIADVPKAPAKRGT